MWSAVNVLENSPKIADLINRDVFQFNVFHIKRDLG